jgi:hypothetical protein
VRQPRGSYGRAGDVDQDLAALEQMGDGFLIFDIG